MAAPFSFDIIPNAVAPIFITGSYPGFLSPMNSSTTVYLRAGISLAVEIDHDR
jgi:hypothetical protein